MFDMWKDFSFKKLGIPMKCLFIIMIISLMIFVVAVIWGSIDQDSFYYFFWPKEKPQTIDSPVEEIGEIVYSPVPMPPFIIEFDPFVFLLPFEVYFKDKETGLFLGKLEIRNAKNKRVQLYWNGLATSLYFPIKIGK